MPTVPPLRRRSVLALAGVAAFALLGGCTGDDGPDTPGADAEPDPDLALAGQAMLEKQELLALYAATLAEHAQLATRLRPLEADHAAHLSALTTLRPDATVPVPSASASPTLSSGPQSSAPAPVPVPADRTQALEALAKAEVAAAGRRIGQCGSARATDLARLLASIGGCEAAHTALLRSGGSS